MTAEVWRFEVQMLRAALDDRLVVKLFAHDVMVLHLCQQLSLLSTVELLDDLQQQIRLLHCLCFHQPAHRH